MIINVVQRVSAFVVILLGVTVMVGWFANQSALIQVLPTFVPMQFNTALLFVLSGIILGFWRKLPASIFYLFSLIIFTLSFATLMEYLKGVNFGIDEVFMSHGITTKTSHPGRMAPNTAISFVFFSWFALCYKHSVSRYHNIAIIFAMIYGLLGMLSIIGYAFSIQQAYSWGQLTHMAVHTSIGFMLLSLSSLTLVARIANKIKKSSAWVDYVIFTACLFLFLFLWQIVEANYIQILKAKTIDEIKITSIKISTEIENNVEAIARLFSRFDNQSYSSKKGLDMDIHYYFQHMPAILSFALNFDNQAEIYQNPNGYGSGIKKLKCVPFAVRKNRVIVALTNDDNMICIYANNASALLSINTIVDLYEKNTGNSDFVINVYGKNKNIFDIKGMTEHEQFWTYTQPLKIYGNIIYINAYPKEEHIAKEKGKLPMLIFVLGSLLSICLLLLLQYRRRSLYKERAFLSEEAVKNTVLNTAYEGIIGVDRDENITFINKAAQRLLGYSSSDLYGKNIRKLMGYKKKKLVVTKTIAEGVALTKDNETFYCKDKTSFPVQYSSAPISSEDNKIDGALMVFTDISKQMAVEETLRQLALTDDLTKLPNRLAFLKELDRQIARANRKGDKFALCFLDIDMFKSINDGHGHHAGDKTLQYIAKVVSKLIRKNDFFARLAGDEFCLILDGIAKEKDAQLFCDKIHEALETPLKFGELVLQIKVSIGFVIFEKGLDAEALLVKADKAMYDVKQKNR